jgi:hypothetical protein
VLLAGIALGEEAVVVSVGKEVALEPSALELSTLA